MAREGDPWKKFVLPQVSLLVKEIKNRL